MRRLSRLWGGALASVAVASALAMGVGLPLPGAVTVAYAEEMRSEQADTSWFDSPGSETEFAIDSAADLAGLAQLVNEGNTFSGKTIKLGADIDLVGREWMPIGNSTNKFQGTFDGQNHTISNLTIDQSNESNVGLFGYTIGGEIKDFTLKNAQVKGYLEVGAVAGTPYTSKYSNIDVTGLIQVEGFSYVGGAFGKNAYANITDVDVTGDEGSYVKAYSIDSKGAWRTYVGGLVGFMGEGSITVSGCNVKIDVTGSTCDIGGILGILHYGNTLENCTYEGSLTLTVPGDSDDTQFGALVGVIHNGGSKTTATTIADCTATVLKAMKGDQDVKDTITAHGDFYNPVTGNNNIGNVSVGAKVNGTDVTVDNYVAKIEGKGYKTLAAAIEAANGDTSGNPVTVTITKSGDYDLAQITRANVTIEAAMGVTATFTVSSTVDNQFNAANITLKNLNFISQNGATIVSFGNCDNLTLEECTFTGDGTGTALYTHQPNITIRDCVFKNFAYAYDTCGDNHAAGKITITGNTFNNIRVPINGYWGMKATDDTSITITGNTFDAGDWDAAYIQLWDYAQYQYWLKDGNVEDSRKGSAIKKAVIKDNIYIGDVVIYATHFDWLYDSDLTLDDESQQRLKHRVLVELENAASATVTNADGSEITAFDESTASRTENGKTFIYSLSEGVYLFDIKPSGSTGDGLVTKTVTVKPTTADASGSNTNKVTVTAGQQIKVAQVGETEYTSLAEAVNAANTGPNKTVTLLANVSIDTWTQIWNLTGVTIDGDGHSIKINAIESGQNHDTVFHSAGDNTFQDLTIDLSGISAASQAQGYKAICAAPGDKFDNVTVISGTEVPVYGIFVGGTDAEDETITITDCTFVNCCYAIGAQPTTDTNSDLENLVVTGSTFTNCDYAGILYATNVTFTGNTVSGGKLNIMHTTQTVTGTNGGCCPHPQYFKVPSSPERQQHKEVKYCIPIPMAS